MLSPPLRAQQSKGPGGYAGLPPGWSTFVRGGYLHQAGSDLDTGGSFDSNRLFVAGGATYATEQRSSVSLSLGYGFNGYGFSGETGFAGLRPWKDIHSLRFSVPVRWRYDANWSLFFIPTIRTSAESGADFDDGISGGGFAGFSYRFGKRLTIGPGFGVITQIEDNASIFPVLIVNWKISDRLSLNTGRGLGATLGPGLALNWKATDATTVTVGGRYERLRFRLDKEGAAPGGIGDDRSFPLYAGVSYRFNRKIEASVLGGVDFGGELRLDDQNGTEISKSGYDPAGFLGFSLNITF
jgi:hypothetical protein